MDDKLAGTQQPHLVNSLCYKHTNPTPLKALVSFQQSPTTIQFVSRIQVKKEVKVKVGIDGVSRKTDDVGTTTY